MHKDKELIDYLPNYQEMSQLQIIDELVHQLQAKDRKIFGLEKSVENKSKRLGKYYNNLYYGKD